MTHFSELIDTVIEPYENNLDVAAVDGVFRVRWMNDGGVAVVVTADPQNQTGQLWGGSFTYLRFDESHAKALMLAIGRCLSEKQT